MTLIITHPKYEKSLFIKGSTKYHINTNKQVALIKIMIFDKITWIAKFSLYWHSNILQISQSMKSKINLSMNHEQ